MKYNTTAAPKPSDIMSGYSESRAIFAEISSTTSSASLTALDNIQDNIQFKADMFNVFYSVTDYQHAYDL